MPADDDIRVAIFRIGRWRHQIELRQGWTILDPTWVAWGRRRAERKAQRVLARHLRRTAALDRPVAVVRPDGITRLPDA